MTDIIQSLWIGKDLSKLEQLSIKSFLDNGHTYHLYLYDLNIKNIPDGTIVKDASEILNKNEIYTYRNKSISAFSNLFRLVLLYKKGGYWVDTDFICIKPFIFTADIVIASEPNLSYDNKVITSFFIKFPKNSQEVLYGINFLKETKKDVISGKIKWGNGPQALNQIVNKFGLQDRVLEWQACCGCRPSDWKSFFDPLYKSKTKNRKLDQIIKSLDNIPDNMVGIHVWNNAMRNKDDEINCPQNKNSLYAQLLLKHNL